MNGNKFVIQFDPVTLLGLYIHAVSAEQALPAFSAEIGAEHQTTPAFLFKLEGEVAVERFPGLDLADQVVAAEVANQVMRDERLLITRGQDVADVAAWRALFIERVREHANSIIGSFRKAGAAYEEGTWEIQRQEYISFLKDPTNPTPYCDALAAARQLSRDALMGLVGGKLTGLATIQGTQHHIESLIEAAETVEAVQTINVRFGL